MTGMGGVGQRPLPAMPPSHGTAPTHTLPLFPTLLTPSHPLTCGWHTTSGRSPTRSTGSPFGVRYTALDRNSRESSCRRTMRWVRPLPNVVSPTAGGWGGGGLGRKCNTCIDTCNTDSQCYELEVMCQYQYQFSVSVPVAVSVSVSAVSVSTFIPSRIPPHR